MLKESCSPEHMVNPHQDTPPTTSTTNTKPSKITHSTDHPQNLQMSNPSNESDYFPPNSGSPLPSPTSIRNYDYGCRELHGELGSKLRLESITPRISNSSNDSNSENSSASFNDSTARNNAQTQLLPTPTTPYPNSHLNSLIMSTEQQSQWEKRKTGFQLNSDFKLQTQLIPFTGLKTNIPKKNPYASDFSVLDPILNDKRRRTATDATLNHYQRYSLELDHQNQQQEQNSNRDEGQEGQQKSRLLLTSKIGFSPSTPTTPTSATYQHHNCNTNHEQQQQQQQQHISNSFSLWGSEANLQLRSPVEDSSILLKRNFNKDDVTELMKEMFSLNHREANKQSDIEITNKDTENVLDMISSDKLNSLNHMKITQWYCCQCGKSYGDLNHFSIDKDEKKWLIECYNEERSSLSSNFPPSSIKETNYDHQKKIMNSSKMDADNIDGENDLIVMDIDVPDTNSTTSSELFYEFAVDKLLNDAINRFDCLRCHHMMCPYCIKARLSDVIKRNTSNN